MSAIVVALCDCDTPSRVDPCIAGECGTCGGWVTAACCRWHFAGGAGWRCLILSPAELQAATSQVTQ